MDKRLKELEGLEVQDLIKFVENYDLEEIAKDFKSNEVLAVVDYTMRLIKKMYENENSTGGVYEVDLIKGILRNLKEVDNKLQRN